MCGCGGDRCGALLGRSCSANFCPGVPGLSSCATRGRGESGRDREAFLTTELSVGRPTAPASKEVPLPRELSCCRGGTPDRSHQLELGRDDHVATSRSHSRAWSLAECGRETVRDDAGDAVDQADERALLGLAERAVGAAEFGRDERDGVEGHTRSYVSSSSKARLMIFLTDGSCSMSFRCTGVSPSYGGATLMRLRGAGRTAFVEPHGPSHDDLGPGGPSLNGRTCGWTPCASRCRS